MEKFCARVLIHELIENIHSEILPDLSIENIHFENKKIWKPLEKSGRTLQNQDPQAIPTLKK